MKGWGSAVWRWLPAVAAVVGVLGLLWVILVVAPPWFVPDQSLEGLRAQTEVRTTLLQGLGGAALLMGAYVTYRQLQTSREGQITERFTRAIHQLGSEHLDVRLGGLYALARIARDPPADRAPIGEVLTAFVRTQGPTSTAATLRGHISAARSWMGQPSTAPTLRGRSLTTARPGRMGSTGVRPEWRRRGEARARPAPRTWR